MKGVIEGLYVLKREKAAAIQVIKRYLRIDEDDDHFGKTDRIERIGNRELLQLLLDP